MDPRHDGLEARLDRRRDAQNIIDLLRPVIFVGRQIPAEAAGPAQALALFQIGFAPLQGGKRPLSIFNVISRAIPLDDFSILVAQRHAADDVPAVLAVGSAHALLHPGMLRLFPDDAAEASSISTLSSG